MPRFFKIVFYLLIFLFSFLLFVYWMIPAEAIKDRLILAAEQELGSGYQMEIEALDTYWLSGVQLEGLEILEAGTAGKGTALLRVEEATARVGLFSLLFGSPRVRFSARLGDAEIAGSVHRLEEGYQISARWEDVNLSEIPAVRRQIGLQATSKVGGTLRLTYNAKQPLRTEGKLTLTIDQLQLKESTIPLGEMGTFSLPALELAGSGSGIQAEIEKGSIRIDQLQLKGKDCDLDVKGRVFLAQAVSLYRINLQGDFEFSPKIWTVMDPLLPEPWAEELKKQKGNQGKYPLSISGQFSSLQIYSGTVKIYPFKPF